MTSSSASGSTWSVLYGSGEAVTTDPVADPHGDIGSSGHQARATLQPEPLIDAASASGASGLSRRNR